MAEIVGAFATPHMPGSPGQAERQPQSDTAQLFGAVRSHVQSVDPDVLVVFDTDHFATFFYDRLDYWQVVPGQITHETLFGASSQSYDTDGMMLEKRQGDVFRQCFSDSTKTPESGSEPESRTVICAPDGNRGDRGSQATGRPARKT